MHDERSKEETWVADEEERVNCDHRARSALESSAAPASVERAAAIFRALGDPARLMLMARLARAEACVSELAAESGDGLSTISQRLRLLRAERLVLRRRDGKHIYYRLADQHVAELISNGLEHADE
ncbi:MAG: helix-turn-helix transcriptional regulator [Deltaproteobacteria bacterium]|nr:helix-turn-helix transcriptional regulator [Deltaproteobacteria bacterium]